MSKLIFVRKFPNFRRQPESESDCHWDWRRGSFCCQILLTRRREVSAPSRPEDSRR